MKLLLIGDLHFRPNLAYSEYISDRRESEKQGVLDQIIETAKDHDAIVLMGDNLNSKNNESKVIREFVAFLERLVALKKPLAIIAGNHEKNAQGLSAIDFLREINYPWKIVTDKSEVWDVLGTKIVLHPYLYRQEVGAEDNVEASKKIQNLLPDANIFLGHQTISGFMLNGIPTSELDEPVLDADFLRRKYKFSAIGHIHKSDYKDNILMTSSVFTNEVNELKKSVWTLSYENEKAIVTECLLKQRGIYKLIDPEEKDILVIEPENIVKVEVTKRDTDVEALRKKLKRFDGSILLERYPNERTTVETDGDLNDYSIPAMIELYAKSKELNVDILMKGFELIQ
jgi:DNA repair exonuclease SbcCD nuclease subunit